MHSWRDGISAFAVTAEFNGVQTSRAKIDGWLLFVTSSIVTGGIIAGMTRASSINMLPVFMEKV